MRRIRSAVLAVIGMLLFGVLAVPASAATPGDPSREAEPLCQSHRALCADPYDTVGGGYVGHDEPSVLFKSSVPGSGNDITYEMTLPKDPQQKPQERRLRRHLELPAAADLLVRADAVRHGVGARVHQELHRRIPTRTTSSGSTRRKPDFIGKHPGNAYMELQFYGPGYVPQFEGFGCSATQYCAAMTIDSLTPRPEHQRRQQRRLRQLHPRWHRADQLGVHHQERQVPGAGQPAVHRHLRRPRTCRP